MWKPAGPQGHAGNAFAAKRDTNGHELSDNSAIPEETFLEAFGQETLSMECLIWRLHNLSLSHPVSSHVGAGLLWHAGPVEGLFLV